MHAIICTKHAHNAQAKHRSPRHPAGWAALAKLTLTHPFVIRLAAVRQPTQQKSMVAFVQTLATFSICYEIQGCLYPSLAQFPIRQGSKITVGSSDKGDCRDVVRRALWLGASGTRFQEHQEFPARMADDRHDTLVYSIALALLKMFYWGMYCPREHAQRPPWKEEDGVRPSEMRFCSIILFLWNLFFLSILTHLFHRTAPGGFLSRPETTLLLFGGLDLRGRASGSSSKAIHLHRAWRPFCAARHEIWSGLRKQSWRQECGGAVASPCGGQCPGG